MIAKRIKYTDYDGNERIETHYFNLTKTELAIMNATTAGSFQRKLQKMTDSHEIPTIVETFVDIIKKAYGVKSDDGKRLIKNEQVYKEFEESPAYDALFMELTNDENSMAAFIKGILPAEFAKEIDNSGITQLSANTTPIA